MAHTTVSAVSRMVAPRLIVCLVGILSWTGCAQPPANQPSELAAFEKAGPVPPSTCVLNSDTGAADNRPYCLVAGDVLELQLPALAIAQADQPQDKVQTISCRVHDDGTIGLPTVGNINVGGKALTDVESALADAYHPKYLRSRPTIVAKVSEYRTSSVAVSGAIKDPGLYDLRSDEMSLPKLIAKAHGIVPEGAVEIRIRRQGAESPIVIALSAQPAKDQMALKSGDLVEVVKAPHQAFTVLGLVKNPSIYPYPINATYTLASALAAAGGADQLAAPRYATIFRQDTDGKPHSRRCLIDPQASAGDSGVAIKPGDVIVVETSPDIQMRQVIFQMLRLGAGVSYGIN